MVGKGPSNPYNVDAVVSECEAAGLLKLISKTDQEPALTALRDEADRRLREGKRPWPWPWP